jgi:hypothetical protein
MPNTAPVGGFVRRPETVTRPYDPLEVRMKGRIHNRVFVGVMAIAAAMTVGSLSANHSWGNYHWARTANPFTLAVGD